VNGGYYENSITHTAERKNRHLLAQQSSYRDYKIHSDTLPPAPRTLGSNVSTIGGKRVNGVNFEMWMSPNQSNMDKRLHDFTSLQTARDLPRCDARPLENVQGWRSMYPSLAASLDGKSDGAKFDMIMVETSYKMMSDFPPPKATLGLRLELDFGAKSHGELFDWTCTTHIYRNGVAVKQASHYRLEAKWGIVAPPFDSMWWALTFVDKIEQKKQAEETGKRDAYQAAQNTVQNFFSELTAVHEIRARSQADAGFQGERPERSLVAVLLWKFSIAPESYVGTTSWRRLIPPPARISTNSPPDQQETSLPPLVMDTMVDGLHHATDLDDKDMLNGQPNANYPDYHTGLNDPTDPNDPNALLGQHDFEMSFKDDEMANFASMQSSFMASSQGEHESQSFHAINPFDYDIQIQGLSTPSHHHLYQVASGNLFETQHVGQKESQEHMYGLEAEYKHDVEGTSARRPLAHFDHSTHDILQAQLGECMPDHNKADNDDDDRTLKAALAAASAMSDLGNPHTGLTAHHHTSSQPEGKQDALTTSASLWEEVSLPPGSHVHPSSSSASFPTYPPHQTHDLNANLASNANTNAFTANHLSTPGLHGVGHHEYDDAAATVTTSSPEIRRLLEMHNQAFLGEESQLQQQQRNHHQHHHHHGSGAVGEMKEAF
jgi:hypothetical protein